MPDGSYVSFVSYKPPSGIYVVDVSSGKIRSIIRGSVNGPSWSPRGHWIAFFVGHTKPGSGATFHLEIAHPDGSDRHTLHLTADDSSDPFWSPDGCTLGYRHSDGGGDSVILSDMKNGNPIGSPTKIALKGSLDYVTWSPNGELLAINERSEPGHLINVYRAPDFDRPILGPIRRTLYPTFSPNSRRIAYSGIKGGAPRILVTRISDGVTHALPKRGRFEHNPSWRPRPRIQPNC
jgi:Tol biopolymer transport system component